MTKQKIVLIAGPTGVGKTASSVILAKKMNTEIISCDSMQIYKGMDIGTAKVTETEADGVIHHMTDVINPDESFSVCDYVSMAMPIVRDINERGKIPLLVGGTGLYADSLIKGIEFSKEAPSDEPYRREMEKQAEEKGNEYIHGILRAVDPETAENIHPNNVKRVIRALEYYHVSGRRISDYNRETQSIPSPYDSVRIYLTRDRENMYRRIDERVDMMIKGGLVDEVKSLIDRGFTKSATAMQALGYKEIVSYLTGEITLPEAIEKIKTDTRHYAKRQLTWFRRDKDGIWLDLDTVSSPARAAEKCHEIIERFMP